MKFYCLTVSRFISFPNNCNSEATTWRGEKVYLSESSFQDQFKNSCFWTMTLWTLKYMPPRLTTSQHMQRNEYSLKVFFDIMAKKAQNLPTWFSGV